MPRLCLYTVLLIGLAGLAISAVNHIELAGTTIEVQSPERAHAYDYVSVKCKITGTGDVAIQAVATNSAVVEKYFDTAIPHRMAFRFELISQNERVAQFKVTNTGDTIWKADGYGKTHLANRLFPEAYLMSDLAPGESVTRNFSLDRLGSRRDTQRTFTLRVQRGATLSRAVDIPRFELPISDVKPGQSVEKEWVLDPTPLIDDCDEFGQAFAYRRLDSGTSKVTLRVQTPPWADRIVVRLIQNGKMEAVSVPIEVSRDSLKLGGKPNTRWTLNGKPVMILVNIPGDEIPSLRKKYGNADNLVLASDWNTSQSDGWLEIARRNGFKVYPYSLLYVRLQMLSQYTGRKLMPGMLGSGNTRVDALDPVFHLALAEFVDKVYEKAKDILYRTSDGKIPMCLSGEQSYGFPWAATYPTRWGGQTPEDVAAFRVWLRDRYSDIAKLNEKWKTTYKDFDEIDPSPICMINPPAYPDPWKEWGPAIEDFDVFRSKIHGEFWARAVAEIKRRHPDISCGMNVFGDYASETEPNYMAFYDWGVKDYQGKGVNWMARRIGFLPEDLKCFEFMESWNSGSPDATLKNIEFWRERGKEVVVLMREYPKVIPGGDRELRSHTLLGIGTKGTTISSHAVAFFPTFKVAYEHGGISGALNDPYIDSRINEWQRRDIELFCKQAANTIRPHH